MPDWTKLLAAEDLRVTGSRVKVTFANGRSHKVALDEEHDAYELRAVVLPSDAVSDYTGDEDSRRLDLVLRSWRRNETARLCGFRLDEEGALVGEATVPKIGLTAKEFQERVRAVARSCDLLEAHLTGEDRE